MKKEKKVNLVFPLEGKFRITSKEQYSYILDRLYSLGYEFQSGKKHDSNIVPLGIRWDIDIELNGKPTIRKTNSDNILINYELNYVDFVRFSYPKQ